MSTELAPLLTGLDQKQTALIEAVAELLNPSFPIAGIDLLPVTDRKSGKVTGYKAYINQLGLTWIVQHDDRRVRSITSECLVDAFSHPKGKARYKATVTFSDGSLFSGEGSAEPTDSTPTWAVNEIAETRAKCRAMRSATAQQLIEHNIEPVPDIRITEIEDTDMKFGQTRAAGMDVSQVYQMDSLCDEVVTVRALREFPNENSRTGVSRVMVVEREGEISQRWSPNDSVWLQLEQGFLDSKGQPLEGVVFHREEAQGKRGTYWKWSVSAAEDSDESEDSEETNDALAAFDAIAEKRTGRTKRGSNEGKLDF